MASENNKNAPLHRHIINNGEHECNAERIPTHRLDAYFKERPKLTLKSQKVKDWSAQSEN
jgi:hypothetical protein